MFQQEEVKRDYLKYTIGILFLTELLCGRNYLTRAKSPTDLGKEKKLIPAFHTEELKIYCSNHL